MRTRLLAVLITAAFAAGCGSDEAPTEPGLVQGTPDDAGHVHGVGLMGDELLIATHGGVFRAAPGSTRAERVGESRRDVMGFTVIGSRIVGSGHPDPTDPGGEPANVGVVVSDDRGRTWRTVALAGEVDFHALGGAARTLYGSDGLSGRFLVSRDGGRTWRTRDAPPAVIAIAADPSRPDRVLVGTPEGVHLSTDAGASWRPVDPAVGLVAWGSSGAWSVDAAGQVRRSPDGARDWADAGRVAGMPVAATASGGRLVVALEDGTVVASSDGGRTFAVRARLG